MQHLFSEFKPTSAAEWKAQLTKDLKGEPFESLVWKNENGFEIQPFYTAEDLKQHYEPAFTHADWEICVAGKSTDSKELNKQLLKQLNGGATSISIHCGNHALDVVLKDIALNYIQSVFYVNEKNAAALKSYLNKNYRAEELACSVFPETMNTPADLEKWAGVISSFKNYKNIKTAGIDTLAIHNQDALAYYEVAVILSGLNEYLNYLSLHKIIPASAFVVKTGVSSDYFIQMAKLRAIRRLWNILRTEYNVSNTLYLIVETSLTNKSISDSYNNLLRTTIESMAAISGGCNELIVTEFDALFPVNKSRAERMAVNQQLILKDESYLDKMADVACGSYYVESITDAIAGKALETMKDFEAQGGYFKCIEANVFSKEIAIQAKAKDEQVSSGKQIAIGVNKFRNDKEKIMIDSSSLEALKHSTINNPVLKFELENYFK